MAIKMEMDMDMDIDMTMGMTDFVVQRFVKRQKGVIHWIPKLERGAEVCV